MPAQLRPGNERDIKVTQFEIEHEDVFHLKNLYKRIRDWLLDEGWSAADDESDDIYETLYWQRIKPNESMEHHIWWRAFKIPENNRYYRYFLKIDMQTLNMKAIEVMHNGQKYGTNKGDLILRIEAHIQLDYRNEWEKSRTLKPFDTWFRKRIYSQEIETYKKDLYAATYRLHTFIKQYFEFKTTVADWGRPFHPARGI